MYMHTFCFLAEIMRWKEKKKQWDEKSDKNSYLDAGASLDKNFSPLHSSQVFAFYLITISLLLPEKKYKDADVTFCISDFQGWAEVIL